MLQLFRGNCTSQSEVLGSAGAQSRAFLRAHYSSCFFHNGNHGVSSLSSLSAGITVMDGALPLYSWKDQCGRQTLTTTTRHLKLYLTVGILLRVRRPSLYSWSLLPPLRDQATLPQRFLHTLFCPSCKWRCISRSED